MVEDAEKELRERIVRKLDDVEDFPEHYLKRLSGSPYYRLRVGDYRVIIDWKKDEGELFVRKIDHRDSVYD
ncbi:MAG: type II toxin-antitoxin system RelE/ParE family toxin [Halobacteria archaeon]|nr:type II toxin-antitoxin system RelE/ParE family toxin [Halobacteria archaeon]